MEGRIDKAMIVITSLLLLCGLVMIYSASAPFSLQHYNNSFHLLIKQLAAAGLGILILVFLLRFDYHRFLHLDDLLLLGTFLFSLVTVLPIGVASGRWLQVGPFALQPTELVKFSLVIYLAATIVRKGDRIRSFSEGMLPFAVVLLFLAAILMNQPDFGMLLLLGALTGVMLLVGGARIDYLLALGFGVSPLIYVALKLAPYRLARIISFLDPYKYSTSSGYQAIQSMMAIGAGGILGRGLGASRAKLFYLPQSHNDFIFSITAEELGLIGALAVIGLLIAFGWRAFSIAAHAPDRFGNLLALGIGFTICFQAVLNLGVTLGVFPVTGLTLPFISNGGSSLLVTLAMVGVLLNISRQRIRV